MKKLLFIVVLLTLPNISSADSIKEIMHNYMQEVKNNTNITKPGAYRGQRSGYYSGRHS